MSWDNTQLYPYSYVEKLAIEDQLYHIRKQQNIFQFWNDEYITSLAQTIKNLIGDSLVLEVCSGNGALSHWLQTKGVNIKATDNKSWEKDGDIIPVFEVEEMEAIQAIQHYSPKMVIMSWVPHGDTIDAEILNLGIKYIINITEWKGCTGSHEFWGYKNRGYSRIFEDPECDKFNISRSTTYLGKHKGRHILHNLTHTTILQKVDPPIINLSYLFNNPYIEQ